MKWINQCPECGCTSWLVATVVGFYIECEECGASTRTHEEKSKAIMEWRSIWDQEWSIKNKDVTEVARRIT